MVTEGMAQQQGAEDTLEEAEGEGEAQEVLVELVFLSTDQRVDGLVLSLSQEEMLALSVQEAQVTELARLVLMEWQDRQVLLEYPYNFKCNLSRLIPLNVQPSQLLWRPAYHSSL